MDSAWLEVSIEAVGFASVLCSTTPGHSEHVALRVAPHRFLRLRRLGAKVAGGPWQRTIIWSVLGAGVRRGMQEMVGWQRGIIRDRPSSLQCSGWSQRVVVVLVVVAVSAAVVVVIGHSRSSARAP